MRKEMGHNNFAVHIITIECEDDLATQIILAVLTLPYWGVTGGEIPQAGKK
jgi:hypothetical protein